MPPERIHSFRYTIAAWILTGVALLLVLLLHLLPALLGGMLVYELINLLKPVITRGITDRRKTAIAVALLSGFVVTLLTAVIVAFVVFFNRDAESTSTVLAKAAEIIGTVRAAMPTWLAGQVPTHPDDLKQAAVEWLRVHSEAVQLAGAEAGRALLYLLIGVVLGAMIALYEALPSEPRGVLAVALMERVARLQSAFHRMVFAQVRISLLNTLFTGIYLVLILPLFGVDLPLKKTMIAITFVLGLLPILGNLVSNTIIVVVSLSWSVHAALASLAFLIVIHKLEYFLNARIVGKRIEARAWELLVAMLAMEAAFGIYGLIAAPLYYAYVKDELLDRGVI